MKGNNTTKKEEHRPDESHEEDFFDLEKLRLSQNFQDIVGVKKKIITVPVRKPDRQAFVRVHSDESYRLQTAVLEVKEDRDTYLVAQPLWAELPGEIVPKVLFTTINRQGVVFIEQARSQFEPAAAGLDHVLIWPRQGFQKPSGRFDARFAVLAADVNVLFLGRTVFDGEDAHRFRKLGFYLGNFGEYPTKLRHIGIDILQVMAE